MELIGTQHMASVVNGVRDCHEIFGPGAINRPAGPNIASYSVPPNHKWSYTAHAFEGAKTKRGKAVESVLRSCSHVWRGKGGSH